MDDLLITHSTATEGLEIREKELKNGLNGKKYSGRRGLREKGYWMIIDKGKSIGR